MISKRCISFYPSAGCSAGVIINTPPSVASSSGGPQEQSRQNMHRFFQGFAHLSPFAIEPVGSCNYPYHSSPLFPRTVDTILAIGQEKLYRDATNVSQVNQCDQVAQIRWCSSFLPWLHQFPANGKSLLRCLRTPWPPPISLHFTFPGLGCGSFSRQSIGIMHMCPLRICSWPYPSSPLTISPFIGSTFCLEPPFFHVPHI